MFLFIGTLPNDPKTNSVKYLTHIVCLNHCSNTKFTPNQVSELANPQYMFLFTGMLKNDPWINRVK